MVEIHEPMRILMIIESNCNALEGFFDRQPSIGKIIRNHWVQLAVLDPHSPSIQLYRHDRFEPYEPESTHVPTASSSANWYQGWRENLGFAVITPAVSNRGHAPGTNA
jgi:hypothetical protein